MYLLIKVYFISIFNFLDEQTVARAVNEFFIGNRCIKTTEDIYL